MFLFIFLAIFFHLFAERHEVIMEFLNISSLFGYYFFFFIAGLLFQLSVSSSSN